MLTVRVGQHSDKGRQHVNQDFHGVRMPAQPLLGTKGIAVALADGIGSSDVSQEASEFAVMAVLEDYYCTSDAWSVRKSAERVLAAANSWLHSRTRQSAWRYEMDRGYVCTLSALILKSTTAHLFHVGDSRIYRLAGGSLEQLTHDHRVRVSGSQNHLSRAVGFNPQLEIDYLALQLERGDTFVLATDGVYDHVDDAAIAQAVGASSGNLDNAARSIVAQALAHGSDDNLTVQIVVVDDLPDDGCGGFRQPAARLPPPPLLEARAMLDEYRILRELHGSNRSHIYLALDTVTQALVALKSPSVDLQEDPAYLERFLMEEWVARRISSTHVIKPHQPDRQRSRLYLAMEYIEGPTLAQWMADNPAPGIEAVRDIVEQIARGLQAFHRLEMLHQDLRPANVMIDATGTVKIIDLGATRVAGIAEMRAPGGPEEILGTHQFTAPEYFLGEAGTPRSDQFSLGVIAYQMLSGRLPYGTAAAQARTVSAQRRLCYRSVLDDKRDIPAWVDGALRKAVHPDPLRRYEALSEFVQDLRQPNRAFLAGTRPPLAARHPVQFWQGVSAMLALLLVALLFLRFGTR